MRKQLIMILCNVGVMFLSTLIFPRITYTSLSALVGMGLLVWLVNLFIKPLLLLITLPLNIITFGLMGLIVNTWTLRIAAGLTKGFSFPNFWSAFFTALMLSLVYAFLIDNKDSFIRKRI